MKPANHCRASASNNRAHADVDARLKRKLQNPEFRAAYNAEDKQIKRAIRPFKLREARARSVADA